MVSKRMVLVLSSAVALAGCTVDKTNNKINQNAQRVASGVEESRVPAPPKAYNPLVVTDRVWAGNASMRLRRGLPLPAKYETSRGVALVSGDPMSLKEIASAIGGQTGLPIRVAGGADTAAVADAPKAGMPVAYEGSLSGLLDLVSGYFGVSWRYDGTSVSIIRYETRVFSIEALPGTQSVKDGMKEDESSGSSGGSMSGSGGGGSSGGGSTSALQQSAEMNVEIKVWDELGQTITSMLGGVGNAVVAPSSGTITVTTTPELMRVVAQFIEEENKRLSKQIAINVEIYRVDLGNEVTFDFAFETALAKLSDFGARYASPTTAAAATAGAGKLSIAILNPSENRNGVFSALSTLGNTSRMAQFPMTTLNNRPVSRRIGKDTAYVSSLTNTTGSISSSSSVSVTTGVVRDGFSLQLTPRLLDDGRIVLQYSLSLTDLLGFKPVIIQGTELELPETASRVFVQQALLKSGSTLFIGGYDDRMDTQDTRGVGSPFNFMLGGGYDDSFTHSMMFMAITPQVLEVPRAERD